MHVNDDDIREAVKQTEILRIPKQSLATFGTTNIYYYLVTEPAYSELANNAAETVVREGRVIAEKPRIVTPYYLSHLEGFSVEARRYFATLIQEHGPNTPGLFYTYKNEPKDLNIVSDNLLSVVEKINAEIDKSGDPLTTIIKGKDEFWDVSLMKFIYEMTRKSLRNNLWQMGTRGLLDVDNKGVPVEARVRIDDLFRKVAKDESDPHELKAELDRWNLFDEYEDRFFAILRKKH